MVLRLNIWTPVPVLITSMALSGVKAIGLRSMGVKHKGPVVGVFAMTVCVDCAFGVSVDSPMISGVRAGRLPWQEVINDITTMLKLIDSLPLINEPSNRFGIFIYDSVSFG